MYISVCVNCFEHVRRAEMGFVCASMFVRRRHLGSF